MLLFWVIAALLTIATLALVLRPLVRPALATAPSEEAVEIALYRSQLAAIDDAELGGRIAGEDAQATRAEIKRRMLASVRQHARGETSSAPRSPMGARKRALFIWLIGLATPVVALSIYLSGGHPEMPDAPFAARAKERAAAGLPSSQEKALVRQLAQRMAQHPEDPRGWVLLGGAYVRQGRYDEAVAAFGNANSRKPGDAEILSSLGEAEVLQSGGLITEDARADFEAAHAAAPDNVKARYFLALARAQAGDFNGAADAWSDLLKGAPVDAPWRPMVEAQLSEARRAQVSSNDLFKGANAAEIAKLSPAERQAMIEQMVDRLAAQLSQSPNDLEGWLRLAKSYSVLGERERAITALNRAAENFRGDSSALARINQARADLGPASGSSALSAPH